MAPPRKTVHLHVGCRKSGTSALQLALENGAARLHASGVAQPLAGRGAVTQGLVDPLRRVAGGDRDSAVRAVAALAARIRESDRPRHLITLEALAEMPPEATALLTEGLAEFDTHVVVTGRPWSLTIPSEWQQQVKSRYTGGFLDYAEAVRDPDGAAEREAQEASLFRRRQDVADVVARWGAGTRPPTVHVVLVPQRRETTPDLFTLFSEVVGFDSALLVTPSRTVNQSLSAEDAEVLRRVNIALGPDLRNDRGDYRHSVRKWVAVQAMMRRRTDPGRRIVLPHHLAAWAQEESQRQLDLVLASGAHVVGDVEDFVSAPVGAQDYRPVTDAEAADAAAVVIAELARKHEAKRIEDREALPAGPGRAAPGPPEGSGARPEPAPTLNGSGGRGARGVRRVLRGARRRMGGLRAR